MNRHHHAPRPAAVAPLAPGRYEPRFSRSDGGEVILERAWPPRTRADEVSARVVDPRQWDPMRRFWAGPSDDPANAEVNESARKLYGGHLAPQEEPVAQPFQRIVAVTRVSGALVGWCGIVRRHLAETLVPLDPGAYIFAIATDHACRGTKVRLEGELMRPGSAVMLAALRQVERDWGGAMPYVWARVKPENAASQRLFDRHGFLAFTSPGEETVRVRPAGTAPA
jgi:ribosomal protein S18 acetylase RimI-like enzyme